MLLIKVLLVLFLTVVSKYSCSNTLEFMSSKDCENCSTNQEFDISNQELTAEEAHLAYIAKFFSSNPDCKEIIVKSKKVDYFDFLVDVFEFNKPIPGLVCDVNRVRSIEAGKNFLFEFKSLELLHKFLCKLISLKLPWKDMNLIAENGETFYELNFEPNDSKLRFPTGLNNKYIILMIMAESLLNRYENIIRFIIEHCDFDVNQVDSIGETILHYAVRIRSLELIKFLLERGATTEHHSVQYGLVLHLAISMNSVEIVQLLLKYGANPNSIDSLNLSIRNVTALTRATALGNVEIVKALLDKGATVLLKSTFEQNSTVNTAIMHQSIEVLKYLIYKVLSVSEAQEALKGLLHIAAIQGLPKCTEFLINCGLNMYDPFKDSHFHYIEQKRPDLVGKIIISDPAPVVAVGFGKINVLWVYLHQGLNPNFRPSDGKTSLLHLACFTQNVEIAKLLVSWGADVNAVDEFGYNAFQYIKEDRDAFIAKVTEYNFKI